MSLVLFYETEVKLTTSRLLLTFGNVHLPRCDVINRDDYTETETTATLGTNAKLQAMQSGCENEQTLLGSQAVSHPDKRAGSQAQSSNS